MNLLARHQTTGMLRTSERLQGEQAQSYLEGLTGLPRADVRLELASQEEALRTLPALERTDAAVDLVGVLGERVELREGAAAVHALELLA